MAGFSDTCLDYRDPKGARGKTLLWPVWVWHVHVPAGRRDGLNVIAHAVLALHACGRTDAVWIAEWLGLDVDLVRYIIAAELAANGWLDTRGRLTVNGRQCLDGNAVDGQRQRAALLFQSAVSNELWPRLRSRLHRIDPEDPAASRLQFRLDRDSGRVLKPFMVQPASVTAPAKPEIAQVLEALRLDRLARHERRQRGMEDDDEAATGAIEFIEARPGPAWLLCEVYHQPDAVPPWRVGDPLGRTPAADWMRREVYDAARQRPELADVLAELLGEIKPNLDFESYRRQQDESARFEVLTAYAQAARVEGLEASLTGLLRLQASVGKDGKRREETEALLVQCQKVLETVLVECLRRWPITHPQRRIDRHWQLADVRRALKAAAPQVAPAVIDAIRIQPGKLFNAVTRHTGSLRPYLAGVLLSFADHPQHPFRSIAADAAQMQALLALSHARDAAGHGGQTEAPPARATVLHYTEVTLQIVQRLTEGFQSS